MSINNGSFRGFLSRLRASRVIRTISGAAVLFVATGLTLGCLFAPAIMAPFAILAWVAVLLGLYFSLRVRTGYLITAGQQHFKHVSQLMDEFLHKSRRHAEDMQQMQLRIYSSLAAEIAGIRQDIASIQQDMTSIQQDMTSIQQDMTSIQQDMASREGINASMSFLEKRISGLQQQAVEIISAGVESSTRTGVDEVVRSLHDYKRVRKVTRQGMQWMKTEVVQEVEALLRLYNLAQDHAGVPLLGGWAMDPAGMLATLLLIEKADPDVVVELGSGTSSIWIAEYLRKRGKGRLISIDHLSEYATVTRRHLAARGLLDVAEVRHAPLATIDVNGRDFGWYDLKVFEDINKIDFLLIDGPPTATGPMARYPAMPVLADRLSNNACVLLDDASRDDEKEAIALWQQEGHQLTPIKSLGGRISAFALQVAQESDIGRHD